MTLRSFNHCPTLALAATAFTNRDDRLSTVSRPADAPPPPTPGTWRRVWMSVCSAHSEPVDDCPACSGGVWTWEPVGNRAERRAMMAMKRRSR